MSVGSVESVVDGLRYVNDLGVVQQSESIGESIGGSIFNLPTLAFGGLEVKSAVSGAKAGKEVYSTSKNFFDQLKAACNEAEAKTIAKKAEKAAKAAKKAGETATATTEATNATANAAKATGKFAKIKEAFSKAKNFVTGSKAYNTVKSGVSKATTAVKSGLSKAGSYIANTGVGKAVSSCASKIASKIPAGLKAFGSKASAVFKGTGAGAMMIFDGVISTFTEVIPAFKAGGIGSGLKQVAKTATKVVATGAGWAGGSLVGKAAGAAIGSLLGPLGTVVGGAIGGFLGGLIGSAVCGGIAKKVTGKSEVEILQDKEIEKQAQEVVNDTDTMNELNALVTQKVQYEEANGKTNEDTKLMKKYLTSKAYGTGYLAGNQYGNDINALLQQLNNGNTSVYNIPNSTLNFSYDSPYTASTNGISQTTQYSTQNQPMQYFS